jgi:hypothetical protein
MKTPPYYSVKELAELYHMLMHEIFLDSEKPYTNIRHFKVHPLAYEVISAPLEEMPLFINAHPPHVREIAAWRLNNNK